MKKLISIILSVMMVLSLGALSVMPVMAATVSSEEPVNPGVVSGQVNGQNSNDVTFVVSPANPMEYTFTYGGNYEFLGWEFNGLETGDYNVVSENGKTITIQLTASGANKSFVANAKVNVPTTPTTPTTPSTGDKDTSGKSPSTGVAIGGIAVAGAGVAMLAALKKRD